MPNLILKNVSAHYQFEVKDNWNLISTQRLAYQNISFLLSEGKKLAIVGETGSGKSSLLKSIGGFLLVDSGEIWWDEKRIDNLNLSQWKPIRKEIQYILQNPMTAFNPAISIHNSLFNVLNSHYSISDTDKMELILSEMKIIHLAEDLLIKRPNQLSGGQLQRFSVVRSFLLNPKLVLCDEPLSALDSENQKLVLEYIKTKSKQSNCSLIWITHQLTFIDEFCDLILIMKKGKVQDFGTIPEIRENPASEYSKTLLKTIH